MTKCLVQATADEEIAANRFRRELRDERRNRARCFRMRSTRFRNGRQSLSMEIVEERIEELSLRISKLEHSLRRFRVGTAEPEYVEPGAHVVLQIKADRAIQWCVARITRDGETCLYDANERLSLISTESFLGKCICGATEGDCVEGCLLDEEGVRKADCHIHRISRNISQSELSKLLTAA